MRQMHNRQVDLGIILIKQMHQQTMKYQQNQKITNNASILFIHIGLIYLEFKRYSRNGIVFIKTGSRCYLCLINIICASYSTLAIVLIYYCSVSLLRGAPFVAARDNNNNNNNNNNNDNINVLLICMCPNNDNNIMTATNEAIINRKQCIPNKKQVKQKG